MGSNELILIFLALVGPVVGFLIGNSKGRPLLGTVLGFFCGILGWLVIALTPAKR